MNNRIEELKALGVDTEGAIRRFAGNAALYEKFSGKFLEDENYREAERALSKNDWEKLFIAAHTLKGVSGNLGLNAIYTVCSEIVSALRAGTPEAAVAAFPKLEKAYTEICSALRKEGQE